LIKFTIITSLYNSKSFLDNYFRTIFSQKVLPDEIILIDDTNNPRNIDEIIEEKKEIFYFKKIYLIKNKSNLGPSISLNKGLLLSKNDLIFRLDVDDLWSANHTLNMISLYKQNPNYLIYANSLKNKDFLTNLKCDDYLINENHLIHSSWLINRNICKNFRYHMLRPSIGLEDYFTLLYYSKKYKFFFNYLQTVNYLNNPNSHGKNSRSNKKYNVIRRKISLLLFKINIKNKNFFQCFYFIFFKFGIIKFLIFIFLYY
jgi:glycosyltransferase involved in cell wall biosynthesis